MTRGNREKNDWNVKSDQRTKARTPGLPIDLIKRSVQVEPTGEQELH